jgi:hypothetical protein
MASRHSLGSDMRRYRLTLSEAQDASWRSIRYIRPQQKLKEVSLLINLFFFNILTYPQRFLNGHIQQQQQYVHYVLLSFLLKLNY